MTLQGLLWGLLSKFEALLKLPGGLVEDTAPHSLKLDQ